MTIDRVRAVRVFVASVLLVASAQAANEPPRLVTAPNPSPPPVGA
jgi:hypothetical protein